jgi:hypothetical protein
MSQKYLTAQVFLIGQVLGNIFALIQAGRSDRKMKRLTLATITAVMLAASMLASTSATVHAAPAAKAGPKAGISMPVTSADSAAQFVGTFDLNQFTPTSSGVAAVGTITGTLTDPLGNVTTVVRNVAIPVVIGATTCDILHLELGPLDLDLLGLVVHLNQIVLDIDAQSGAGNLLGNLLCAVLGLLDNPSGLARLLNNILAILG